MCHGGTLHWCWIEREGKLPRRTYYHRISCRLVRVERIYVVSLRRLDGKAKVLGGLPCHWQQRWHLFACSSPPSRIPCLPLG